MDNRTILMVEDNREDFMAAKRAFTRAGLRNELVRCEDGRSALDYLHRRGRFADPRTSPRPALILLDLNLPYVDGHEVLHEIRSTRSLRSIPVVVLTTSRDERDIQECYEQGANSYIQKPVDLQGFFAAIGSLREYWFEIAILPRNQGGSQTMSEAIAHATQDLRSQNAELERSNEDLDDFAHIVSHDLKEPLRGIHNFSTFLLEDLGNSVGEEARSQLETLVSMSKRLETLIDDLLYYSRVGRTELRQVESSAQEIAEGAVQKLADFLAGRQATVRFQDELPDVMCDPVRLGEVFQNLVTNAVKYNDAPDKRIEIGVLRPPADAEEREGGKAPPPVFFVRDNGIGIRERDLGEIFRPFKRLHGRGSYGGGSGVGLTITRKLVERHGGRIWVESTPGVGTTFYFTVGPGHAGGTPPGTDAGA